MQTSKKLFLIAPIMKLLGFFVLKTTRGTSSPSTPSCWDMDPHTVREKINQRIMSIQAETPIVFSAVDQTITHEHRNTPIRIYTPTNGNAFPIILFIHGGAWVAGSLDTHDNVARYLCSKTKAIVVSVGYLNSPEGKFPLPLEQCYDALTWITKHAHEFAGDATRLAVVGDSAGGNMAAALCLMARDRSGPKITVQVLINPALDLTCKGTLTRQNDALDFMRWQVTHYLANPTDTNNPYASPLRASDLHNLPTAIVILAEHDDLRDDGQNYANQLVLAGTSTRIYCQQGIGHLAGDGARASLRAQESLNVAVAALQKAFFNEKLKIERPPHE